MNKILSLFKIAVVGLLFSSCVKNADHFTDFSTTNAVLEMRTAIMLDNGSGDYVNIAGLPNFGKAGLDAIQSTFPNDSISFYVNLASDQPLSKDLTLKVGVNPDLINTYNEDVVNHTLIFELMPDSLYTWTGDQTVTIAAGERTVLVSGLSFNYDKIDPTKNYMLPIGVLDGDGVTVSANMGAIYFHAIGNPMAGNYDQSWYRWNDAADTTGPPNSTVSEHQTVSVPPIDPTTLLLPEGYLNANGLGGVSLGFTNTAGVISDPFVFIGPETQKAIDGGGFKVISGPTLVAYTIVGDASTRYVGSTFRIYFEIENSSGGNRKTVNIFTKQ